MPTARRDPGAEGDGRVRRGGAQADEPDEVTRARAGSPPAPTGCAAAVITATAMATTVARPPIATSDAAARTEPRARRDEAIAHGPSGTGRYATRQNVAHPQHLPSQPEWDPIEGGTRRCWPPTIGPGACLFFV